MNINTLKECISEVGDKRRTSRRHVLHKFEDIIIIGLCAVISDGEDFADTFRRVFEAVPDLLDMIDVSGSGKIRARKQEENDVQGRAQSRSPAGRAFPWKKVNAVAVGCFALRIDYELRM